MVDNGLTRDAVAGTFSAGTQVEVLGQTNTYYHVRTDECTGFVPLANLSFGPDTAALVESCHRSSTTRSSRLMDRYNEYHDQLAILYNRYGEFQHLAAGDPGAGASQLAMDFGFEWLRGMVCILHRRGAISRRRKPSHARPGLAKEAFGVDVGRPPIRSILLLHHGQPRTAPMAGALLDGRRPAGLLHHHGRRRNAGGKLAERLYQRGFLCGRRRAGRRGDGLLPARLRRRPPPRRK